MVKLHSRRNHVLKFSIKLPDFTNKTSARLNDYLQISLFSVLQITDFFLLTARSLYAVPYKKEKQVYSSIQVKSLLR
jgi:hypothetical protein